MINHYKKFNIIVHVPQSASCDIKLYSYGLIMWSVFRIVELPDTSVKIFVHVLCVNCYNETMEHSITMSNNLKVCEFGGLEWWNGTVEWTTGVEYWTGLLECHAHKYTISLVCHG